MTYIRREFGLEHRLCGASTIHFFPVKLYCLCSFAISRTNKISIMVSIKREREAEVDDDDAEESRKCSYVFLTFESLEANVIGRKKR